MVVNLKPFRLPLAMSYYITCQVLRSRYGTIAENGPPQTLTRVFWFNVLNYYFSSVDGFSPEHNYIPNLNTPLVKSELAVSRLEDKSLKAFMVIDCTKRDIEGHDDEWRKSYDQFKAHLQEVFRNEQRDTGAGVLYGAVTIGRYIRFYILKRGDAEMQNYGPVNTAGQPQAWETLRDEKTIHDMFESLVAICQHASQKQDHKIE